MTTTASFNFRTKFKKLLNDDQQLHSISRAFEKFCALETKEARDILWQFTCQSRNDYHGIVRLGLTADLISPENILATRNELRFQYEQTHSKFLEVTLPEEIKESYEKLLKSTDSIVAYTLYHRLLKIDDLNEKEINRILYLLQSEKENNYFGGIRSLNFEVEEAEYLKPFHIQIHDLLKALYENKILHFYYFTEDDLPFLLNEEEDIEEEPVQPFKSVTLDEILNNIDVFTVFAETEDMNLLVKIGKLGFDLNEVMIKREEINNLIKAIKALN